MLDDCSVTPSGLARDRSFMVVDSEGSFLSQRRMARLAVVRPRLEDEGARLVLSAPGVEPVVVEVDPDAERRDVALFGVGFRGVDQGESVAAWLSAVLGVPSRLVRVPPEHDRVTGGETPGTAGFADSAAVLLTAERSLAELNERLAEGGHAPVPMGRFRPNIVVDGWGEPYVEDRLRRVEVGQAELGFAKVAVRCVVTTVDQETGRKVGPEPLRTLAGYRRVAEGGVAFGVRMAVTRPGKVSVGDEVRVSRWAAL